MSLKTFLGKPWPEVKWRKTIAKVVDAPGCGVNAAAIFYEGGTRPLLFGQLIAFPPSLPPRHPPRFLRSLRLPHAIGSSRFGGHCTAPGGCNGGMVGESIFHDDVAASSGGERHSSFLAHPLTLIPFLPSLRLSLAASIPHSTWLPLLRDRREHPLQDAGRSILRRRLPRIFPPFKSHSTQPTRVNPFTLTRGRLRDGRQKRRPGVLAA